MVILPSLRPTIFSPKPLDRALNPACTLSNSSTARACASASSISFSSLSSNFLCSASFFSRFSSLFCASRLLMAHSRQKRWPWLGHETGSRDGRRQSWHDPNGRNESRVRRVERLPQELFSSLRSWAVKKAREVFLLPVSSVGAGIAEGCGGTLTVSHGCCALSAIGSVKQIVSQLRGVVYDQYKDRLLESHAIRGESETDVMPPAWQARLALLHPGHSPSTINGNVYSLFHTSPHIYSASRLTPMAADERPYEPPALTRAIHNGIVGTVGFLCRGFLYGLSRTEVHGLEHFQALVDERSDPRSRERGLITGR